MYEVNNDKMLEYFQANEEVKHLNSCCNILYADETNVQFYMMEDNNFIEMYEDSGILKVNINTDIIEPVCEKIREVYHLYDGVEICLPSVDLEKIAAIRKYFNISDTFDCHWNDYALLSKEKLPPVNIDNKIIVAKSEELTQIKNLDNDEWEFLPDRVGKFRQTTLLFLLYENNVLAGYLEAVRHYKNYYNIRNVFVHENYRGNNFGSRLAVYYAVYCLRNNFIPHYGSAMTEYSEAVAIKSGFEIIKSNYFFSIS
jgi:hypothetical protein